ncbi:hypothetical protein [Lunatibacter salilacus]|uniref:hypothetical protein n=1 Tax=Lunatibacter salilacus TaxID=2483804 RepID=UPI00131D10CF|nr:hypothetical protein [Lunatibacter salilacus]
MKTFLNIIIVLGYVLFGSMWLKSLYQVIFYNSIFELFEFKEITTTQIQYGDHSNESKKVTIAYEFEVGTEVYRNEIVANKEAFVNKVGMDKLQRVYFNSLIPSVNYLENWKLDTYYKLTFVYFSIFLSLIVFFHLKIDKERWISKYRKSLYSR